MVKKFNVVDKVNVFINVGSFILFNWMVVFVFWGDYKFLLDVYFSYIG